MRIMSELSLLTSLPCFLSMSSGAVHLPLYLVCAASYTSLCVMNQDSLHSLQGKHTLTCYLRRGWLRRILQQCAGLGMQGMTRMVFAMQACNAVHATRRRHKLAPCWKGRDSMPWSYISSGKHAVARSQLESYLSWSSCVCNRQRLTMTNAKTHHLLCSVSACYKHTCAKRMNKLYALACCDTP